MAFAMRAECAPFKLEGGPTGVLLVHGFTGSPADMRPMGEFLHAQGLTVSAPLLPGHATEPADLNRTSWAEWYGAARNALDELSARTRHVFACGLSMGGVLSLHLAAHARLDGVATLASGLRPKDWRVPLVPVLKYVMAFDVKSTGEDIKDPEARGNFLGYSCWPTWGVHELLKLNRHVREDLPDVRCPLLVIHARDDHVVPVEDAAIIVAETGSRSKRQVILENSWHVVTLDYERERVQREVFEFIRDTVALSEKAAA